MTSGRQLAEFTERDLHDVGLSWSDAVFEAGKAVLAGVNAPGRRRLLRGTRPTDFSDQGSPAMIAHSFR